MVLQHNEYLYNKYHGHYIASPNSQRISSIQDADKILVIDDGKVLALGNHEELLKTCTQYKETYEAQQKGGDFDEQ